MKGTLDYAPFRKGYSYGSKSDRDGTGKYWVEYYRNKEWISIENDHFEADNEDDAAEIALSKCNVKKDDCEQWKFVHECSGCGYRSYEIIVPNGRIVLFHKM